MKKVLFAFLFIGLSLSAQTTVNCDTSKPITYTFPTVASVTPNSDGVSATVKSTLPASSVGCTVATVTTSPGTSTTTTSPIVQFTSCMVSYGQNFTCHLPAAPKTGNQLKLFIGETYNTPITLPAGFSADFSSTYDTFATKTVNDGTQDFTIGTGPQAYAKALLVETIPMGTVDVKASSPTLSGSVSLTTVNANDYAFALSHGYNSGVLTPDSTWTTVGTATDYINQLLVQYKALSVAGQVSSSVTSTSPTQLIISSAVAYKAQ